MQPGEAFLLDQFPLVHRTLIPRTLKTADAAADQVIQDTPMLRVPSADDNRGRIIQWAVDFHIEGLIKSGEINVDYRWRSFERPTGRYLEIRLSHSVMTVSQVSDPKQQPRDVCFRANKRLASQLWLRNLPDPSGLNETAGLPHVLLVHGHKELNFAQLGIPNPNHASGYIFRTGNLMDLPHVVTPDAPPMENTDIEAVMTLKQDIDKWLKDNGGEQ